MSVVSTRPVPDAHAAPWGMMVTLSVILHLTWFGLAVGLPRLLPRQAGPGPVYVVDLVSMPSVLPGAPPPGGATAPAPPPPAPQKQEKSIKLPEPAQKKPQPKKTEKPPEKKPEKKPETKPEPARTETKPADTKAAETKKGAEQVAASTPGASPGAAVAGTGPGTGKPGVEGGTGSGGADAYTFYYALLDRKIRGAWKKPLDPENLAARRRLASLITMTLSSSGRVLSLQLSQSSGFDPLDQSATRAVRDAEPFPPFPYQLGVTTLTINFEFVLTP